MNDQQKRLYLSTVGRLPPYSDVPEFQRQQRAILTAVITSGGGYSAFAAASKRLKAEWDAKTRSLPAAACVR